MKTLASIFVMFALACTSQAETITRADILKTVQHLQQRCHEAEAAQTAAQDHASELQGRIDALAEHDKAETAKAYALAAQNKALAGRLDKLVLALAVAAGLLVWSFLSRFAAILPPPYNLFGPIAAGVATAGIVGAWLRYVL